MKVITMQEILRDWVVGNQKWLLEHIQGHTATYASPSLTIIHEQASIERAKLKLLDELPEVLEHDVVENILDYKIERLRCIACNAEVEKVVVFPPLYRENHGMCLSCLAKAIAFLAQEGG